MLATETLDLADNTLGFRIPGRSEPLLLSRYDVRAITSFDPTDASAGLLAKSYVSRRSRVLRTLQWEHDAPMLLVSHMEAFEREAVATIPDENWFAYMQLHLERTSRAWERELEDSPTPTADRLSTQEYRAQAKLLTLIAKIPPSSASEDPD